MSDSKTVAQHSLLPWCVERIDYPRGLDASIEISGSDGSFVAQTIMRELATEPDAVLRDAANAEYIVEAANNFPALLAQRDALLVALKAVLEYMPSVTAFQRQRIRTAEAAIASVEGQAK